MERQSGVGISGSAWTARVALAALGAGALAVASPAVAQEATEYAVVATVENVGAAPTGVAVNTATNSVYVTSSARDGRTGTLAVVNGSAETLDRLIFASPDMPNPAQVGVDSTTGQVFVTNPESADVNTLTVLEQNAITSTVNVARMATSVTVDETDSPHKVYLANYGDDSRNVSGITILHVAQSGARVHATTSFSPNRGLTAVAVDTTAAPHKAWAVNANSGTDPLAGSLTVASSAPERATFTNWSGVLPAPRKPGLVAVRPDSHTLYLADQLTDQVHLVDVSREAPATAPTSFTTDRPTGDKPVSMTYDATTDRLFVLYADAGAPDADGELAVLDASSGDVLQHLPLPSPGGMALDSTTGTLWITDTAHGKVRKVAYSSASGGGRFRAGPAVPRPVPGAPGHGEAPPPPAVSDGGPQRRELPGENERGQLCGAVTTRPKC